MQIRQLSVRFTETAAEEVNALVRDLKLITVAEALQKSDGDLPNEFKSAVTQLLSVLTDLFSIDLPGIEADPDAALRTISRDINLARLLRERGLFRLYRLVNTQDANGLPLFMTMINPMTDGPFAKQEEFIGWFCDEAHVARSLVFMRLATIERLQTLGFSLEEAFGLVISKPYAIRETMNLMADWNRGDMVKIDPEKILRVAERIAPETLPQLEPIIAAVRENPFDPNAQDELKNAAKSVIAGLLTEIADHERAKDALEWVRTDLLLQPDITYTFDLESKTLMVELHRRQVDAKTGEEYYSRPVLVPFVPDALDVPDEIIKDLLRRLPIRNRNTISLDI